MNKIFTNIAHFILNNPDVKQKSEPEIYNIWFAKEKCTLKNISDVKVVLEYIRDLKKIPENLLSDSLRKETPYE